MGTQPSPPPSAQRRFPAANDELATLMWRDLGRRGRPISALRSVLTLLLIALVAGMLATEPSTWRISVFGVAAVAVAAMTAGEFAWLKVPLWSLFVKTRKREVRAMKANDRG